MQAVGVGGFDRRARALASTFARIEWSRLRRDAARVHLDRWIVLGGIVVLVAFFSWWSVDTSGLGIGFGSTYNDYYNQLATAFLHGSLSLLETPPPALVHLSNPYDPALNSQLAQPYHDLILYKDHFYVSWGPTAALVLFIPWRILGIGDVTDSFAVVVFSVVGLAFATTLVCWLADRYLAGARLWKLALITVALAGSSVEPYLMRRPAEYEVAISCAYCFVCIALWALITGCFGELRPLRIGVGSLCLGLAILSRYDLAFLVVIPATLLVREWLRRGRPRLKDRAGSRSLGAFTAWLVVPLGCVLVALFAYNTARFGSPLQLGAQYELADVDQMTHFNYQLSSILPGLFYYLIAPIQTTLAFPYFALGPPPLYPFSDPSYMQTELTSGIFTTTPILAALLVGPVLLWGRRLAADLKVILVTLATCGLVVALLIAWGIPGSTMRYEADFATLLLVPAVLIWLALGQRDQPRAIRWTANTLGTAALLLGAAIGFAISFTGPYDELRQVDQGKYIQLGNVTDFIPTFVTMLIGHPEIVKDTYECGNGECGIASPGLSHWTLEDGNGVELDVVAPFGGWRVGVNIFNLDHRLAGSAVTVVVGQTTTTFHTRKGQERIYLPLHQGLNRMLFGVPGPDKVSFYALSTSRIPTVRHSS